MINKMGKLVLVTTIFVASLDAAYKVNIEKTKIYISEFGGEKCSQGECYRIELQGRAFGDVLSSGDCKWCPTNEENLRDNVYSLRSFLDSVKKIAPKCNLPLVLEAERLLGACGNLVTSENMVNTPMALQLLRDALVMFDIDYTYGQLYSHDVTDPEEYFVACISDFNMHVGEDLIKINDSLREADLSVIKDLVKRSTSAISIPVIKNELEKMMKKYPNSFFDSISKNNAAVCLYMVHQLVYLEASAYEFLTEEEIKDANSAENLFFMIECKANSIREPEGPNFKDRVFRDHLSFWTNAMKDLVEFEEPFEEEESQRFLVDDYEEHAKYIMIYTRNLLDILEKCRK